MFNKAKLKFDDIFENRLPIEEVREYLIELYQRGEDAAEIAAAASAMREHVIPLEVHYDLKDKLIDVVGTGGDKSNSFNVSSTVAILLSACGSYVAKHGNRSITSKSGSADMLDALGINLNLPISKQLIMLEDAGFVFMFAQNHHPAMKYIMPIRKSIDHRTIFNILGPLANPANANKHLLGVFDKSFINKMASALEMLDVKRSMVVSSRDKMDEISISDITYATSIYNGKIEDFIIDPQNLGFKLQDKKEILGGDCKENALITKNILCNKEKGAKLDIVLLNAAAALVVDEKARDFQEGIEIAKHAIESGLAQDKLEQLIRISALLSKD